jgi:hypothetical protein
MNYCQEKDKAQEIQNVRAMRQNYQRQKLDVTHACSEKQQ